MVTVFSYDGENKEQFPLQNFSFSLRNSVVLKLGGLTGFTLNGKERSFFQKEVLFFIFFFFLFFFCVCVSGVGGGEQIFSFFLVTRLQYILSSYDLNMFFIF